MKTGTTYKLPLQPALSRRLRAQANAKTGPVGGLLDLRSQYVPAVATNISKTFERVRSEIAKGMRL